MWGHNRVRTRRVDLFASSIVKITFSSVNSLLYSQGETNLTAALNTSTMDLDSLFYYSPSWCIIVCKECGTVPQTTLYHHIRLYHNPLRIYKPTAIKSFVQKFNHLPILQDPTEIYNSVRPSPGATPIPFLPVFYDGISCELCKDDGSRYICRARTALEDHRRKVHGEKARRPGRKRSGSVGGIEGLANAGSIRTQVPCQSLFRNFRCRYYMVDGKRDERRSINAAGEQSCRKGRKSNDGPSHPEPGLRDLIDIELAGQRGEDAVNTSGETDSISLISPDVRQQSQWLQMTEWAQFLEPHKHELC